MIDTAPAHWSQLKWLRWALLLILLCKIKTAENQQDQKITLTIPLFLKAIDGIPI